MDSSITGLRQSPSEAAYGMMTRAAIWPRAGRTLLATLIVTAGGCGGAMEGEPLPANPSLPDSMVTDAAFAGAVLLHASLPGVLAVEGEVAAGHAPDVYDLGPVQAGETLLAKVTPRDGLDPMLGIFNADSESLIVNDDRDFYGGDLSAVVSLQFPRDSASCYLAVAASPRSETTGAYSLRIERRLTEPGPPAPIQMVYLNFDGAEAVVMGKRDPVWIPAFEATQIALTYAGRTEELTWAILQRMRRSFDGFRVEFFSSRDGPPPAPPYTVVHFGAHEPGLLGIADYVDEFNAALEQKAIVYVDTFSSFMQFNPTLSQMAVALANVASHETGHLLGLNHTADAADLMTIDAAPAQMLSEQTFRRARLHHDVFPIGYQNAARLLLDAVGGDFPAKAVPLRSGRAAGTLNPQPFSERFSWGFKQRCH